MEVIRRKFWFLSVSALLIIASIVTIAVFGFRPGIDFSGGTLWQVRFEEPADRAEIEQFFLAEGGFTNVVVTEEGDDGKTFFIRAAEISEESRRALSVGLSEAVGPFEELEFETIGSAIGAELRSKAVIAFILVILGISLYIAFAFRKVSQPVASWKYGVITLLTLFHDALIPAGIVALLGRFRGIEVDINFIVALLVVMGFSVHDTIVVFDRIRENLKNFDSSRTDFNELVGRSVGQTMARSINTSLTLVFVLAALFVFGAPALRFFVVTIAIGTIVGTYSSICIASPLLTLWKRK